MKKYTALFLLNLFFVNGVFSQTNLAKSENPDGLNARLANLTQQISDGLTENQKQRIAVVELADS